MKHYLTKVNREQNENMLRQDKVPDTRDAFDIALLKWVEKY